MAAAVNGGGGDTKAAFARIYDALKEELLRDPAFEYTESSHQWIDRVMLPPSSSASTFLRVSSCWLQLLFPRWVLLGFAIKI